MDSETNQENPTNIETAVDNTLKVYDVSKYAGSYTADFAMEKNLPTDRLDETARLDLAKNILRALFYFASTVKCLCINNIII